MYAGRVVETGPVAEVFDGPRHPYARALLSAVPLPDPVAERARRRIVLPGEPRPGGAARRGVPIPAPVSRRGDPSGRWADALRDRDSAPVARHPGRQPHGGLPLPAPGTALGADTDRPRTTGRPWS
ncbi:hypothetical protein ACRAWF_02035 [Streptomyces sp. L7]